MGFKADLDAVEKGKFLLPAGNEPRLLGCPPRSLVTKPSEVSGV
jgi:hypothetical protein